jgi:hypothetical protein
MPEIVYFNRPQADRIARAVQLVEGEPLDLTGKPRRVPRSVGGGTNVRIVRITTALGTTAYGKYNARTITPTTITGSNWTATTGAPTVSGMFGSGSEATEDDAIFLNLEELGNDGTTYVLTQDNPDATNIYAIGLVVGTQDGKLLVSGVSLKSRVCEE